MFLQQENHHPRPILGVVQVKLMEATNAKSRAENCFKETQVLLSAAQRNNKRRPADHKAEERWSSEFEELDISPLKSERPTSAGNICKQTLLFHCYSPDTPSEVLSDWDHNALFYNSFRSFAILQPTYRVFEWTQDMITAKRCLMISCVASCWKRDLLLWSASLHVLMTACTCVACLQYLEE